MYKDGQNQAANGREKYKTTFVHLIMYSGLNWDPRTPAPPYRAQRANLGFLGLQGKKLGLWDFIRFEVGILEIMLEIGIIVNPKLGFWNLI